jgi:glycosyltransferase involved in cell wall biosynthesis
MKTVLHITPYMHPASGGPPVVVDRVCRRMSGESWRQVVLTTDAFARGEPLDWAARYREGDAYRLHVFRTSREGARAASAEMAEALESFVVEADLAVIHTCWTWPGLAAMRTCRTHGVPYVVMPHGMLDPHSLRRKWLKKQVYGRTVEWPLLRQAAAMVYTHAEEQRLAESAVKGLPRGYVAPLGADCPPDEPRQVLAEDFLARRPELRSKRRVLFLSRLHPKKGLDLLVPAMAIVRRRMPDARLVLVGDGDAEYVAAVRKMVATAGLGDVVTFTGALAGREKWSAFAAAELFVLPSYQENFGLVVVEALSSGVPVLLSRRVNIWQEAVQAGAGWDCELTAKSVAEGIVLGLSDPAELACKGARGRRLVAEQFRWEHTARVMAGVFEDVFAGRGVSTRRRRDAETREERVG